jgi:hypothetical protein
LVRSNYRARLPSEQSESKPSRPNPVFPFRFSAYAPVALRAATYSVRLTWCAIVTPSHGKLIAVFMVAVLSIPPRALLEKLTRYVTYLIEVFANHPSRLRNKDKQPLCVCS